jgi:hypothetical protein
MLDPTEDNNSWVWRRDALSQSELTPHKPSVALFGWTISTAQLINCATVTCQRGSDLIQSAEKNKKKD